MREVCWCLSHSVHISVQFGPKRIKSFGVEAAEFLVSAVLEFYMFWNLEKQTNKQIPLPALLQLSECPSLDTK